MVVSLILSSWHNLRSPRKDFSIKESLHQLACGHVLGGIVLLKVLDVRRPRLLEVGPFPSQETLSWEERNMAAEGKKWAACVHSFLSSCSWLDVMPFKCLKCLSWLSHNNRLDPGTVNWNNAQLVVYQAFTKPTEKKLGHPQVSVHKTAQLVEKITEN